MPSIDLKDVNMTTYKFMTLNFWCKTRDLSKRIERMGKLVRKHNPDIIALQENFFQKSEIEAGSYYSMNYVDIL